MLIVMNNVANILNLNSLTKLSEFLKFKLKFTIILFNHFYGIGAGHSLGFE